MQNENKIILFNSEYTDEKIELIEDIESKTVRASQKQIALIFGTTPQNVTIHFKDIFESGELDEKATCKDYLQVQIEGSRKVKRNITYYNLKAIIAVGYRVNSPKAIEFRNWAGGIIADYTTKGIAVNEKLLAKSPELVSKANSKIQELRGSTYNMMQLCTDIIALSIDYKEDKAFVLTFFASLNNKLLFAVSGNTAGGLVVTRCDGTKPLMNLNSTKGEIPTKQEARTGRGYLYQNELEMFFLLISNFHDKCKLDNMRGIRFYMRDWDRKIDELLEFNNFKVLKGKGNVSKETYYAFAEKQHDIYTGKSIAK